jgi:hypothetical protein
MDQKQILRREDKYNIEAAEIKTLRGYMRLGNVQNKHNNSFSHFILR